MIKTDSFELTDEYQVIADSKNCSLVTIQSHNKFNVWAVADDRTQAERLAANNNVDIGHYIKSGETGRFELPSGKLTAKIVQKGKKGLVVVTRS
ncbi:MAG: hypothetical protein JKX67_00540 [Colwellia sp.]|nr:hypothetical protein [Colwellia sp.]